MTAKINTRIIMLLFGILVVGFCTTIFLTNVIRSSPNRNNTGNKASRHTLGNMPEAYPLVIQMKGYFSASRN